MRATPYAVAFTRGVLRALGRPGDLAVRIGFFLIILVVTVVQLLTARLWVYYEGSSPGTVAGPR